METAFSSIAAGARASAAAGSSDPSDSGKVLVVFFSRSGNTRVIAGVIGRALMADMVEVEPARPYPADYFETVAQARRERDNGDEPALKTLISGIADFQTIILCFPIWGETAPPVIRSFLAAHDLSGKTLVPVITHGGYGLGNSLAVLRSRAPNARLVNGFTMQGPQERQTVSQVTEWLKHSRPADQKTL
jgi:flavodoxin